MVIRWIRVENKLFYCCSISYVSLSTSFFLSFLFQSYWLCKPSAMYSCIFVYLYTMYICSPVTRNILIEINVDINIYDYDYYYYFYYIYECGWCSRGRIGFENYVDCGNSFKFQVPDSLARLRKTSIRILSSSTAFFFSMTVTQQPICKLISIQVLFIYDG